MGLFKRWRAKRAAKKQLKHESSVENAKTLEETKVVEQKQETTEKKDNVKVEDNLEKAETKDSFKYHVSQNKDKTSTYFKQWRVRKSGSKKTIKYFNTQKEAITFAEDLAEKSGTTIVIHKVDGSIRKQNY